MTCACISRYPVLHPRAILPLASRLRFRGRITRPYPSATSTTASSRSGFLSAAITCELNQSNVSQKSEEWFALRKDKLTASTFSTALGFWKGNRRSELWHEKVFSPDTDSFSAAARACMNWGVVNEPVAIERYKSITGREVDLLGFATHTEEQFGWVGASPDGLLGSSTDGGILEVKCPYNKGKPELALPWSTLPFYYMPQVQGQMEVLDRDWVDLYCWTQNGSTIFRVHRDRQYWQLMTGILREFWWENVIPARELLLLGKEQDVKVYEPSSTHRQTGLMIVKSLKLAAESELLCREIAGEINFFKPK